MKVKDAMTRSVMTFSPEDSLDSAIDIFSGKEISGAPVVKNGKIVGILSQSDILKRIGLKDLISLKVSPEKINDIKGLKIGDVMSRTIYFAKEEDDVALAIKIMNEKDINRLPVVDEKGSLIGILTRGDVLRVFAKSLGSWVLLEKKEPIILETDIDKLLKIIEEKGSITTDALAGLLNVSEEKVEEWGRILEEHHLIKLEYPPFGKPKLKVVK
ncbi:MAG TPA: CBS domain-containing protein [archaeon]|nr:CBS domain-containing protein [archaeon]